MACVGQTMTEDLGGVNSTTRDSDTSECCSVPPKPWGKGSRRRGGYAGETLQRSFYVLALSSATSIRAASLDSFSCVQP